MLYNAIALSDRFENERSSGTLDIVMGSLVFKGNGSPPIKMPLRGVDMRIGGAGNRYVFFTHKQVPDLTFYTDDRSILKNQEILYEPGLQQIHNKLKKRKRTLWLSLGILFGLILTSIISLFLFRGNIVEHIAGLIPPSQEQQISKTMRESAIAGKEIVKDSALMAQLKIITDPLVKAVNDTAFKFDFTIIKDETLNAFALPGGAVIIHSGLIDKAKSAEEVAGVLAHEISHVTRRHHLRGIIGNMGIFFVIRVLLGDVAGLSSDIATAGAALSSLKYSRDFEREADDNGYQLLLKAKIDPQGMIHFFETMNKEGGDLGMADFLSSHPATKERISNLQHQKKSIEKFEPLLLDFNAFKNNLNQYFKTKH